MSKKKQHHEEHADESWLLPYADLLTLLLALFIVMFAMGKVDQEKLEEMSREFNIIFAGGTGIFEKEGKSIIEKGTKGEGSSSKEGTNKESKENKETEELNDIKEKIQEEVKNSDYANKVNAVLMNEYLEITIQDVVLFDLGGAEILSNVYPMMKKIASTLKNLENDNNIRIVGHTDNIPINTEKFRSNWDLSAMRAINVMNFMVKEADLNPKHISVQAYAEFMPKFDNSTAEGRAKNRRVEILVFRKYNENEKVKPDVIE